MNQSVKDLVDRGYDINEVESLISFSDDELDYISDLIFTNDSAGCFPQEKPVAVFIGGQPGSGKSVMSMKLKSTYPSFFEVAMDNYRMYHPNYRQMEKTIKEHWISRDVKENDTPGNDIASFTHGFSGELSDIMINKAKEQKMNMLIEWNMREPYGPLEAMKDLKSRGYTIIVAVVSVNKDISEEAYKKRADIMNTGERTMRRVSERFHSSCIRDLPSSVNYIKEHGVDQGIIDNMVIVDRNDFILWDQDSELLPGDILRDNFTKKQESSVNDYRYAELSKAKESIGFYKINNLKKPVLKN